MDGGVVGIVIGGLLPAVLFGIGSTLQKASSSAGISIGWYMLSLSLGYMAVALLGLWLLPERDVTGKAGIIAAINGVVWGGAYCFMMYGLGKLQVPMSKLLPIVNTNTLVGVLLCLVIFMEWQKVSVGRLIFGSLLVVVGGTLVATS